jgi:RHS repeat-associated protein
MQADYRYDAQNRRIAKVVDPDGAGAEVSFTERYVYDGEHIALVFDGSGTQTERYLHGPAIDQVLAGEIHGQTLWALGDHQGTVRQVVDNAGAVINQVSYDSFGGITGQTNPSVTFRFGYTGREHDAETGFIYYRARYQSEGRFISQDPIGFSAGDANLYRYVGNGPANATDPDGLYGRVVYQQREMLYSALLPIPVIFRAFDDRRNNRSGQIISYAATFPVRERDVDAFPRYFGPTSFIALDITRSRIAWTPRQQPYHRVEAWGGVRTGDDSGHIIGNILGGNGHNKYNFFSQVLNINRGEYSLFFRALNAKLDAVNADPSCPRAELNMTVELHHGASGRLLGYPLRPHSLTATAIFSDGTSVTENSPIQE